MKSTNKVIIKAKIVPLFLAIIFLIYIFFANIYKAKWIGENPWSFSNLILVVSVFFICFLITAIYYYLSHRSKKDPDSEVDEG